VEARSLGCRLKADWVGKMEDNYFGFDLGKVVLGTLKLLKERGLLEEEAILDLLWEAKEARFAWDKADIKELIKL